MIVKDEILTLSTLLDSVKDYVTDYVIVDTGSTDGTPEMLEKRGIKVHHKDFEDFATTRNHALRLAQEVATGRRAYIMLVDADFELHVEDREKFLYTLESYEYDVILMMQKSTGTLYSNKRLVKAGLDEAHWVGAVHEVLRTGSDAEMELPAEVSKVLKIISACAILPTLSLHLTSPPVAYLIS